MILDQLIERWSRKQGSEEYMRAVRECIMDVQKAQVGTFRPLITLDSVCHFKKFRGCRWKQVIEQDPDYVEWCMGNIAGFELDEYTHTYLVEVQSSIEKASNYKKTT